MTHPMLLSRDHTALLVVDMQDKLLHAIHQWQDVLAAVVRMIKFAQALEVPVLVTEQYPQGLGPTNEEIRRLLPHFSPREKTVFNCFGAPGLADELAARQIKNLVLVGIEAHICVEQTALSGLAQGMAVHIAADAVGSRQPVNRDIGLAKMRQAGAVISCSETILYEWLERADHPAFKKVLALVK